MAANPRDILLRPIITEKKTSVNASRQTKYTFQVPLTAKQSGNPPGS